MFLTSHIVKLWGGKQERESEATCQAREFTELPSRCPTHFWPAHDPAPRCCFRILSAGRRPQNLQGCGEDYHTRATCRIRLGEWRREQVPVKSLALSRCCWAAFMVVGSLALRFGFCFSSLLITVSQRIATLT